MNKLSQEEANELINALKRKIEEKIFYFPHEKGRLEFNVLSDDEKRIRCKHTTKRDSQR